MDDIKKKAEVEAASALNYIAEKAANASESIQVSLKKVRCALI